MADSRLKKAGVSGFNQPKRTPSHKTKSHVVVAKTGSQIKTIRFGQQGVTGDRTTTPRSKSFKARHGKNIAKGKTSGAYWANKLFWAGPSGSKKSPPKSQKLVRGIKRRG